MKVNVVFLIILTLPALQACELEEYSEPEIGETKQTLAKYDTYQQLIAYNGKGLAFNSSNTKPFAVSLTPGNLNTRRFFFQPISPSRIEIYHGDRVRVRDPYGRYLRHSSSYASLSSADSHSEWQIISTSGSERIDVGETFRLQATDNS